MALLHYHSPGDSTETADSCVAFVQIHVLCTLTVALLTSNIEQFTTTNKIWLMFKFYLSHPVLADGQLSKSKLEPRTFVCVRSGSSTKCHVYNLNKSQQTDSA